MFLCYLMLWWRCRSQLVGLCIWSSHYCGDNGQGCWNIPLTLTAGTSTLRSPPPSCSGTVFGSWACCHSDWGGAKFPSNLLELNCQYYGSRLFITKWSQSGCLSSDWRCPNQQMRPQPRTDWFSLCFRAQQLSCKKTNLPHILRTFIYRLENLCQQRETLWEQTLIKRSRKSDLWPAHQHWHLWGHWERWVSGDRQAGSVC